MGKKRQLTMEQSVKEMLQKMKFAMKTSAVLSTVNGVYGQIGQAVHLDRIKQKLGHGKRFQQNAKDLIVKAKIMREFLVQGKIELAEEVEALDQEVATCD